MPVGRQDEFCPRGRPGSCGEPVAAAARAANRQAGVGPVMMQETEVGRGERRFR